MKISYSWLQTYFNKKLPQPEKLAELLTMHSFEASAVKEKKDWIIDIDVTPNRASDCLSHRGVARELAAILEKKESFSQHRAGSGIIQKFLDQGGAEKSFLLDVLVKNPELCLRYMAKVITGVKVGESPKWLKERLEAIGQRSINNIVDATNYAMFDLGQPLHAFDLDKLSGQKIIVRKAKKGEKITTLDGETYDLDESILVIADEKEPIALAGIKGGKKAEIDKNTKNIVLESANFDPINIRRASKKLNLKTESSLRFEAGIELLKPIQINFHSYDVKNLLGVTILRRDINKILESLGFQIEETSIIPEIIKLAKSLIGRPYVYNSFDCSSFTKYLYKKIGIEIPRLSVEQFLAGKTVNKKDLKSGDLVFSKGRSPYYYKETPQGVGHVGIYIGNNQVIHASAKKGKVVCENIKIFEKEWRGARRFLFNENFLLSVTVPSWRLDIKVKEDLIEEIARIYGYQKIPSLLPEVLLLPPKRNNDIYWENFIKDILVGVGWTEVYNYSFSESGKIEISNPISRDKKYLRQSLVPGLLKNIKDNLRFFDEVKIFEMGKVFSSENKMLAGAISYENFYEIKGVLEALFNKMGLTEIRFKEEKRGAEIIVNNKPLGFISHSFFELNLEELIILANEEVNYRPLAKYPAVIRDLAVLVERNVRVEEVLNIIENSGGQLLVDVDLFDMYENEKNLGEKKSLAFHLIFQSLEKTLTDGEVNNLIIKITQSLRKMGWEVR